MWEVLPYTLTKHNSLVVPTENISFETEKIHIPDFNVDNPNELFFLSRLFEYVNMLNENQNEEMKNQIKNK